MSDNDITNIKGVGKKTADSLKAAGYKNIDQIAEATIDDLIVVDGVGRVTARKLIDNAKEIIGSRETEEKAPIPFEEEVYKEEPKKEEVKPKPKKEEVKPKPKKKKQEPPKPKPKPKEYDDNELPIQLRKPLNREIAKRYKKPNIKPKRTSKTNKKPPQIELKGAYGIVKDIVYDKVGNSRNLSIIVDLRNKSYPTSNYVGRTVTVKMSKSGKEIRGKITRVHGKEKPDTAAVIARMNQSVSPHILSERVEIL